MAQEQDSGGPGSEALGHRVQDKALRAVLSSFSQAQVAKYRYWLNEYKADWKGEVPYRLHEQGHYGLGSAPPFSDAFVGYIGHIECADPACGECRKEKQRQRNRQHFRRDDARYRTSRAFRKLRSIAPREFDALYMYCMHDQGPSDIARAMNAEMARKDRPERYTSEAIVLLLFSGVDKVMGWW